MVKATECSAELLKKIDALMIEQIKARDNTTELLPSDWKERIVLLIQEENAAAIEAYKAMEAMKLEKSVGEVSTAAREEGMATLAFPAEEGAEEQAERGAKRGRPRKEPA